MITAFTALTHLSCQQYRWSICHGITWSTSTEYTINNVGALSDMEYVYTRSNTVQKQQLVRVVFDNGLYYENGSYRTPWLIPQLAHNELIMREKKVLFIEKKGDFFAKIPSGGAGGSVIEPLSNILTFFKSVRVA